MFDITTSFLECLRQKTPNKNIIPFGYSLSARILHRAPPLAPSGPKFSNSKNCCKSENEMPPKFVLDMEGHRGNFRSKNVFFFKFLINRIIFLFFRYG